MSEEVAGIVSKRTNAVARDRQEATVKTNVPKISSCRIVHSVP
jgi:hypothetical protein